MMHCSNKSGAHAEDIAATYLKQHQIAIIERNFHWRFGEIDLIGLHKPYLLFIEVRYRRNTKYLSPVETISQAKCRKIILTSHHYLQQHHKLQKYSCRYDIIAITSALEAPKIDWVKDAFQSDF